MKFLDIAHHDITFTVYKTRIAWLAKFIYFCSLSSAGIAYLTFYVLLVGLCNLAFKIHFALFVLEYILDHFPPPSPPVDTVPL